MILPGATGLLHYMLRQMNIVLRGLRVFPATMRRNLDRTGGLVFSHRVLLALLAQGVPRDDAYEIVQAAATAAHEGVEAFRDALTRSGRFTAVQLAGLFEYDAYLRHVDAILERIGIPARKSEDITVAPGVPR